MTKDERIAIMELAAKLEAKQEDLQTAELLLESCKLMINQIIGELAELGSRGLIN